MADLLTKQLQPATFRGFSFLCPEESASPTGRKIAIHDYPNSGKRFAQDLGLLPPEFEVSATIKGDDFLQKAINFERVLKIKGPGKLVLPHQGTLNVVALPYKKNYSQKSVGVVTFTLKFTISNTDEVPARAPVSKEDVYQAGEETRIAMQDRFEENYTVPEGRENILTVANDYRNSIVATTRDYTAKAIINNSKLQKIVRDVQSDLTTMIRNPQQLSETLIQGRGALANGLFATFSTLLGEATGIDGSVKTSAQGVLSNSKFGENFKANGTVQSKSGVPLWSTDTGTRIQRNNNRVAIIETTRINALVLGYETAANFDYDTSDEIESAVSALEEVYTDLFLSDDDNLLLANDNDFKIILDNMKDLCYGILDQKAQQVYTIGDFEVRGVQSVFGIAYKLYAEQLATPEDLQLIAERLVDLNPNQNPAEFSGTVRIFEVR